MLFFQKGQVSESVLQMARIPSPNLSQQQFCDLLFDSVRINSRSAHDDMKQHDKCSINNYQPQILQRISVYVRNIHNLSVVLVREERLYTF